MSESKNKLSIQIDSKVLRETLSGRTAIDNQLQNSRN